MKALLIAAATFGLAAAAPSSAQMAGHTTVTKTTTVEHNMQGGGMRHDVDKTKVVQKTVAHHDNGWHRGWTNRKVCVTRWQNHKRVRHCAWKHVKR